MRERGSLGLGGVLFLLVIVALLAVGVMQWRAESGQSGMDFVGKVVAISGPFTDVGVVEEFRPGRSLVIRSESTGFSKQAYYQLDGACSVVVVADTLEEYREQKAQGNERAAAKAAQATSQRAAVESPQVLEEVPRRPASFGTPTAWPRGTALGTNSRALSPEKERSRQAWDDFVATLSRRAGELDRMAVEAKSACSGASQGWQDGAPFSATGQDSRGDYVFLQGQTAGSAVSMDNATSPQCRSAIGRFDSVLRQTQDEIRQAESRATNSGFYNEDRWPILKKYGMEDRYYNIVSAKAGPAATPSVRGGDREFMLTCATKIGENTFRSREGTVVYTLSCGHEPKCEDAVVTISDVKTANKIRWNSGQTCFVNSVSLGERQTAR